MEKKFSRWHFVLSFLDVDNLRGRVEFCLKQFKHLNITWISSFIRWISSPDDILENSYFYDFFKNVLSLETLDMIACMYVLRRASQVALLIKSLPAKQRRHKRHGLDPWVKKIHWSGAWQPASLFFPGESRGQRSLVSYSPQGLKTEAT